CPGVVRTRGTTAPAGKSGQRQPGAKGLGVLLGFTRPFRVTPEAFRHHQVWLRYLPERLRVKPPRKKSAVASLPSGPCRYRPDCVVAGTVLRLYHQRWIPPRRPGDRVMPLRFVPFAVAILCASLLAESLWPGKTSRGQEPESKLPAPAARTITLQQDKISLNNALQILASRTKLPARSDLDENPELKVNLKNAGYWEALDTIAGAAGARVNLYGSDGIPVLVRDTKTKQDPKQPISHSGIFRVAVQHLNATLDYETGISGYRAVLEVAWEPHFLPYFLETRAENLVMHDPSGTPVKLSTATGSWVSVEGRKAFLVD